MYSYRFTNIDVNVIDIVSLFEDVIQPGMFSTLAEYGLLKSNISDTNIKRVICHHIVNSIFKCIHESDSRVVFYIIEDDIKRTDLVKFFGDKAIFFILSTIKIINTNIPFKLVKGSISIKKIVRSYNNGDEETATLVRNITNISNTHIPQTFSMARMKRFIDKYELIHVKRDYLSKTTHKFHTQI